MMLVMTLQVAEVNSGALLHNYGSAPMLSEFAVVKVDINNLLETEMELDTT